MGDGGNRPGSATDAVRSRIGPFGRCALGAVAALAVAGVRSLAPDRIDPTAALALSTAAVAAAAGVAGVWAGVVATAVAAALLGGPAGGMLLAVGLVVSGAAGRRRRDQPAAAVDRLRLLTAAVEAARDAVLITDAEPIDEPGPRIVYANPAFLRHTGYTLAEVVGRSPRFLQGPGTDRAALAAVRQALTRWQACRAEVRNYRKDGTPFWAELDITPVADPAGRYTHWIAVQRDVTPRKRAEAAAADARQAFLLRLSDRIRSLADPADIQEQAAGVLGEYLGVSRAGYADFQRHGEAVVVTNGYAAGVPSVDGVYRYADIGAAQQEEFRAGRTMAVRDVAGDTRLSAAERATRTAGGIGASMSVPLVKAGRLVAVLFVHHKGPHDWRPDEVAAVEATAERTWAAVERAKADAAVRASEAQLRLALDAAALGTFVWHPADDRTECDAHMLALFGLAAGQPLNLAVALGELIHPDDRTRYAAAVAAALDPAGPGELRQELRVRQPGGGLRHLAILGRTATAGVPPRAVSLAGVAMDVTARQAAAAALRASEERLRLAVRASNVGLWDWNLATNEVDYSPEWKAQLGYADAEVRGHYDEWERLVHPDDRTPAVAVVRRMLADPEAGYESEFRMRHRDGSWRWVYARAEVVRDAAGTPVRMLGCHIDITDRKRAEQALREREGRLASILQTAADAIVTVDGDGGIVSANPAAERLFGYAAGEMVGQDVRRLVFTKFGERSEPPAALHHVRRLVRAAERGQELSARRTDGTLGPVELSVSAADAAGVFTVIVRDIARRRELEQEVVEVASQEQRRIGQDLHDSVGQELTALRLLAGELAAAVADAPPATLDLVGRLADGVRRCQQELRVVLHDLLPVPVDREGLMAALADLADRTCQGGKLACTFDCPAPVTVADNLTATQLYLIAQEAAHNAVKHAGPRTVRITLTDGPELTLSVRDDGTGMRSAADPTGGLGLRIMRNRAAIIGGRLTVEPAAPTGTAVSVSLPRRWHE